MRCPLLSILALSLAVAPAPLPAGEAGDARLPLADGWSLQSSAQVAAKGDAVSTVGFVADGWHKARVPNTVVGALVEDGTYADPYFGMNLRKIPGTTYKIGERFTLIPTPDDSPFKPAWWYRTEFDVPAAAAGRPLWLHFDGINYRANIWVNGTQIAHATDVAGVFRRYEFDVTKLAQGGGEERGGGRRCSVPSPTTSPSCGSTGTRPPRTRTWACGATCTSRTAGRSRCATRTWSRKLDLPSLATRAADRHRGGEERHRPRRSPAWCAGPSRARGSRSPSPWRRGRRKLVRFTPADDERAHAEEPAGLVAVPDGIARAVHPRPRGRGGRRALRPAAGALRRPAR